MTAEVRAMASCSLCAPTSPSVFGPTGNVCVRSSPIVFAAFTSSFCLRSEYSGARHFPDALFVGRNGLRTSIATGLDEDEEGAASWSLRSSFCRKVLSICGSGFEAVRAATDDIATTEGN